MPSGFADAVSMFQSFAIDFPDMFHKSVLVFIYNIVMSLPNLVENISHVRIVLTKFLEHKAEQTKAEKCQFHVTILTRLCIKGHAPRSSESFCNS